MSDTQTWDLRVRSFSRCQKGELRSLVSVTVAIGSWGFEWMEKREQQPAIQKPPFFRPPAGFLEGE